MTDNELAEMVTEEIEELETELETAVAEGDTRSAADVRKALKEAKAELAVYETGAEHPEGLLNNQGIHS